MRIVLFAYACEPHRGSEPGAGWMWSRLLARFDETWVVTRSNNRVPIEAELAQIPERDRLHFVWVDLPERMRGWKRGQRGIRLYYVLWQIAAHREIRRLHREMGFDLVWHLTLSTAWLGSAGALLGPPFVYGPIGGGVKVPWRLLPSFGPRGVAYEGLRTAAQIGGRYANPLARVSWRRARLILTQNDETKRWLPRRHRRRAVVFPHIVIDDRSGGRHMADDRVHGESGASGTALFAGRLLDWKGPSLALRALAHLPGWQLVVAGTGPAEARLGRLAFRLGVADRVQFRGHLPRDELFEVMREEADVLLFPSTHDEAGWVVVEASLTGLPVVCLQAGGPPVLGGHGVPVATPGRTAKALAAKVREVVGTPPAGVEPFWLEARTAALAELLARAGLVPPGPVDQQEASR